MKLKTLIRVIEYSNFFAFAGIILFLLAIATIQTAESYNFVTIFIAIALVGSFIIRKILVNHALKKTMYPGILYSVLEKLGLNDKLELHLSDTLLNDQYKPSYPTEVFLVDNNLQTHIGRKKIRLPLVLFPLVTFLTLGYFSTNFELKQYPLLFLTTLILCVISFLIFIKGRKYSNDADAKLIFDKKGLTINEKSTISFSWQSIFDWEFKKSGDYIYSTIVIHYKDEGGDNKVVNIYPNDYNTGYINLLMLLAHFRGKYGEYANR